MDTRKDENWGLIEGRPDLEDVMEDTFGGKNPETINKNESICLGTKIVFPLELLYQVLFISGKRGSGKSYTAAVLMEEFERLGLQFVCFDALDAHGFINQLEGVERIEPKQGENINMKKLLTKLKSSNKSLIINLSQLPLDGQQTVVSDYCETLLESEMGGKGLMTILEECQDFVPQMGRPSSFPSVVRLCKLGRASGYGVTLISQRPAAVAKEALSQASVYVCHNIINTKDLDALKEQLSFGTDKESIKKILSGITYSTAGEAVVYSPEFFRDEGYIVVGKINTPRRTEHKGANIEVRTKFASDNSFDYYDSDFDTSDYGLIKPIEDFTTSRTDYVSSDHSVATYENRNVGDAGFRYAPEQYEFDVMNDIVQIEQKAETFRKGKGVKTKALTSIALISVGLYTVLRSLGRRN